MKTKMKKLMLLAMSFMTFHISYAQVEDTTKKKDETIVIDDEDWDTRFEVKIVDKTKDSTHVQKKRDTDDKPKKPELRDFWSGIDFGFNGYLNSANGTTMPAGFDRFDYNLGKSTYFGFNLLEKGIPIYRNNVVLVTGLGIDYNNYRFRSTSYVFGEADSLGNYPEKDYITNRLKTFYATVPLLLAFDFGTENEQSFHIAAGVVAGVRFASYTKEKYHENGMVVKENTRGDFDLNPLRLNATARVGYGNFTLFANYSLTPLFKNETTNPELYPFSMGVSFGG